MTDRDDKQLRRCVICFGIEGGSPTGGLLDRDGVCVTCQPCPRCGEIDPDPFGSTGRQGLSNKCRLMN